MDFNYSIIIPHKQSLPFLERCVKSMPIRNDVQIIVVDDNSDLAVSEWEEFSKKYGYVELFLTDKGLGAGYARNIGLSKARGKWILFADADDFFHERAFDKLDEYLESDYDVIYFYADSVFVDTMKKTEDRIGYVKRYFDEHDIEMLPYRHSVPWGKMIRRSLIETNHLLFEEVEVSNDVMFSVKLASAAKNIDIINRPLYCATVNSNSLRANVTAKRLVTRIKVRKRANDFLYDNDLVKYRIPFNEDPWIWIKQLLPKHPLLFIWSIWESRYKGGLSKYIRDLYFFAKNHFSL